MEVLNDCDGFSWTCTGRRWDVGLPTVEVAMSRHVMIWYSVSVSAIEGRASVMAVLR